MKLGLLLTLTLGACLSSGLLAQDPGSPPSTPDQAPGSGMRHGGRGFGAGGWEGRGVAGTVTEVASDHYTVKNESGETYIIHYSANTRIVKQQPMPKRENDQEGEAGMRMGRGNPPEPIKATDIKVGDAVMAMGEVDQSTKSVGAMMVMQLDPERAKQMQAMQAEFGKTWLAGRVSAVNDTAITLQSPVDQASHTFVADENTSFRRRREPITLADVQVGDNVRVQGAVKNGVFTASQVVVMPVQARGGPVPRPGPPPQ